MLTADRESCADSTLKTQESSGIYDFSNIRYAQPPTGELRFQESRTPETNQAIQTGEEGRICYQSIPNWFILSQNVVPQFLSGMPVNPTYVNASENPTRLSPVKVPPPSVNESEDCLFLDIQVPENVFNDRHNGDGAAVIVWIYGGGLTLGSKNDNYDPTELLAQTVLQTGKQVIFVALNYRVSLPS